MKKNYLYPIFFCLVGIACIMTACKKEKISDEFNNEIVPPLTGTDRKPVAYAGNDTSITWPANAVRLDGRMSYDPEHSVISYHWSKIAGPGTGTIASERAVQTEVTHLTEGVYLFELKVTDAGGLTGSDTMQVTVLHQITDPMVDVYVAGSERNGMNSVAKYWKNGNSVSLSDGNYNAMATAIAIHNGDVHVIGFETRGNITVALYWKNGNPVFLTNGYSRATAIAVSDNDVYVAGWEIGNNGTRISKFWKNGVPVSISGNPPASAMAINGNDIYVAGSENDGDSYTYIGESGDTVYANYSVAKYWKNGIPVTLSNGHSDATTTAISLSGSDVYVAGWEYSGDVFVARYWKNGVPVNLVNGNYTYATAIGMAGNDLYVAGWGSNGPGQIRGKYWKNGSPFLLPTNANEPRITSMAFYGNDVFIAGYDYDYNGTNYSVAKYWKNGIAVPLTNESSQAIANGIAVVPR